MTALLRMACVLAGMCVPALAMPAAPAIPIEPGVVFLLAVSNTEPVRQRGSADGILQGDYEVPVSIERSERRASDIRRFSMVTMRRESTTRGSIPRLVRQDDLANATASGVRLLLRRSESGRGCHRSRAVAGDNPIRW